MAPGHPLYLWLLVLAVERGAQGARWRETRFSGLFPQDLQEVIRRLTNQQLGTTQNLHSLLPRLNLPLLRSKVENRPEDNPPLSLLNFPPQSTTRSGSGSQSHASASASVKRPSDGANVEARASAYASVKDVNHEEHLGEDIDLSEKESTTKGLKKTTQAPVKAHSGAMDGDAVTKGEPYAQHRQQLDTVQIKAEESFSDVYFVAIVAGCCAVGIFGVISAGICFYKLQKSRKAAADVDYPAYGVTGPNKDLSPPNGDRKLAQSAQMYHYQHQKQQMIAVEKAGSTKNTSASDVDSEEENEEGDYTVYECPGLASTGEMEVKNPLFHDDSTPVSPPVLTSKPDNNQNN